MWEPPDVFRVDIIPVIRIAGEWEEVPIGDSSAAATRHIALEVLEVMSVFAAIRRSKLSINGSDEATCQAAAARAAAQEGLTSPYSVSRSALTINHVWINNGWVDRTTGQFSYAFPITKEAPGFPPEPMETTLVVATSGGRKTLIYNLVLQVQYA
jgi:hypothetical protein